ncbi:galactose oxidase [Mycena metata]|uniref:Galactose oxidase n=1 Tax=Mycena metata TaxID=1033252 RepID=A0AAD7MK36_9AGAR|nr:galactose oxidase [Mycena metata]
MGNRPFALVLSHLLSLSCVLAGPQRRQSIPSTLPGNWSSLGCYTDNVGARTLTGPTFTDSANMTVENCIAFCDSDKFIFAGLEFMQECYCDNFLENGATTAPLSDCDLACTGNPLESCGGPGRLNIFWSGAEPPPPPTIPKSIGNWRSLGCYSDNVNGQRSLVDRVDVVGQVSLETCTSACFTAGMPFSGAEFSDECYCGASIENGGGPEPISDCSMICAGNSSELCGGPNRLSMYNYTGTDLPPPPVGGGGGAPPAGGVTAIATDLPSPWAYVGCYVDGANGRVLGTEIDNAKLTMETCVQTCIGLNNSIAGGEFSTQCFCGNELVEGSVSVPNSECNMACGGNSSQACGAGDRLSIYSTTQNITVLPVPVAQNTSLPGFWEYQGCLEEANNVDIFPWEIQLETNNSATTCLSQCAAFGYAAAGMEFGDRCYCGDLSDVVKSGFGLQPESDCNIPCTGDPIHLCGGVARLQYYLWTGPALQTWHKPAITGAYKFFVPGVVVPLIATVGINNKVTFLEKGGTSEFLNSTGAYELDLSLVSNFSAAWRTMHVKSDVFCSGSITLPDKGARQLNVGGWSLDSTQGVRLYTPDGSPGVNGTNDWEENFQELHLQRQRWYPTAAMLPNGTVMVIGGETGSNGPPEPNVEILPFQGENTVIFLDWLNRTDPNNLYPFVFVLPSGNLFVAYYNEARILDAGTFDTIQTLPNIPASVSSFLGGRTYPLEGAAVMFPQHAPYTDPLEVLICGGSTPGPGTALDNCVSIQPEVKNATWALERMPSPRVMPCMVALPDGTFLILNGAVQGVAGFGLANDPNLGALLYDPTMPFNQRISILNTTIVARLYHSEAILLPDGRVLVSGSDPESGVQPEEFRIEVYIPPYLAQGFTQPSFNITDADWAYGSKNEITVTLHQGTTSTMKVSLIAATSSTHGNAMGSRTIFPEFSCVKNTCTITAPPNAFVSPPGWHQLFILDGPTPSHSAWVRIGGDPAQIGNWPDLPDFTLPGV